MPSIIPTAAETTASSPPAWQFDSIEDTVSSLRAGNFIVVVDSLSRENEGDLIIAAEDMTTEKMAFMVHHTSGLICVPLLASRCVTLQLPQMVASDANADPNRTAYTVSVDADHPTTTTGISAHDRALTCRVLADPDAKPRDLRRPGHIFPLRAREGGVRERKGHTEAAVEFCRLAGKREISVISEVVDDGEEVRGVAERRGAGMLRRGGCLDFGKQWGLRVCTIEDLVAYVEGKEKAAAANGHANGAANG